MCQKSCSLEKFDQPSIKARSMCSFTNELLFITFLVTWTPCCVDGQRLLTYQDMRSQRCISMLTVKDICLTGTFHVHEIVHKVHSTTVCLWKHMSGALKIVIIQTECQLMVSPRQAQWVQLNKLNLCSYAFFFTGSSLILLDTPGDLSGNMLYSLN